MPRAGLGQGVALQESPGWAVGHLLLEMEIVDEMPEA